MRSSYIWNYNIAIDIQIFIYVHFIIPVPIYIDDIKHILSFSLINKNFESAEGGLLLNIGHYRSSTDSDFHI